MTVVAVCSTKGSPGVTTLACALAASWPSTRRVVLVEADPAGGDLAVRFGLHRRPGLTTLAIALRDAPRARIAGGSRSRSWAGSIGPNELFAAATHLAAELLDAHVQSVGGVFDVLVGPATPSSFHMIRGAFEPVAAMLASSRADLVIDCGRLEAEPSVLLGLADLVLLLVRPELPAVSGLREAWARLVVPDPDSVEAWRDGNRGTRGRSSIAQRPRVLEHATAASGWGSKVSTRVSLVTVGNGALSPLDLTNGLGIREVLKVAWDPRAARVLRGEGGSLRHAKSALLNDARRIAERVVTEFGEHWASALPNEEAAGTNGHVTPTDASDVPGDDSRATRWGGLWARAARLARRLAVVPAGDAASTLDHGSRASVMQPRKARDAAPGHRVDPAVTRRDGWEGASCSDPIGARVVSR
jgi:hypothetical protein